MDQNGEALTEARFFHPSGVAADAKGNILVADCDNHCIRKITPQVWKNKIK
jgi:hypothetical protein